MLNLQELSQLRDDAEQALRQLSDIILKGLKPPPGPYAFFYHSSHALERLNDCHHILERLFDGRRYLTKVAPEEMAVHDKMKPGETIPPEFHPIQSKINKVTNLMRQDMETLYMFAWILLDQWAFQALYVIGKEKPESEFRYPFVKLVNELECGRLERLRLIWEKLKTDMLWLNYQIRFYRNRFIVHFNRPWQRSSNRSMIGDDFTLASVTPPGWIDEQAIDAELKEVLSRITEKSKITQPRVLLESVFNRIGTIDDGNDREAIYSLMKKIGCSTPSFQAIGERVYRFIHQGSTILSAIAKSNLGKVNLGRPLRTSD